jgi:hypothetical protein
MTLKDLHYLSTTAGLSGRYAGPLGVNVVGSSGEEASHFIPSKQGG